MTANSYDGYENLVRRAHPGKNAWGVAWGVACGVEWGFYLHNETDQHSDWAFSPV